MPTVEQWVQALTRQYRVNVESSQSLCEDVEATQQLRNRDRKAVGLKPIPSKNVTPWPQKGRSESILVRPVDLLHALGRITTPPITELIDLSSTWAEIRYLWAFEPNFETAHTTRLRLGTAVKELDFHQKTLLSDEFGVGFAALYMSVFERATDPVDAFVAKRTGQLSIQGWSRRSLPDYIFKGRRKNHYYIVECKGTQSAKSTAISQLQRGSEQVVTIGISPPAKVTRLVVASWLQQGITILVVDPDPESEPRILSRWPKEEISKFAQAKQLSYIGDHRRSAELLKGLIEPTADLVLEERKHQVRETNFGTYVGAEESITMPDGHLIRMFRGLHGDSYRAIASVKKTNTPLLRPSRREERKPFFTETITRADDHTVRSFSADGSLFEVEIR